MDTEAKLRNTDGNGPICSLESLPMELLVSILMELDIKSVLLCRRVSSFFKTAISESIQLQYHIELAIARFLDVETLPLLPTCEKLARLRTLQANWDGLTYFSKTYGSLPENQSFDFNGGIFASANNSLTTPTPASTTSMSGVRIALVDLPSRIASVGHQWREERLEIAEDFLDFTMDVGQDLLILLQAPIDEAHQHVDNPGERSSFRVVFCTLSTSAHHPKARVPHINFNTPEPISRDPEMRILENKVAILFGDRLVIWNWNTGGTIGILPSHVDDFAFVDAGCIIIVDSWRTQLCLVSLSQEDTSDTQNLTELPILTTLKLPLPAGAGSILEWASFQSRQRPKIADPNLLRYNSSLGKKPFVADPSEYALSVVVCYESEGQTGGRWYISFTILSSNLQHYIRKGRAREREAARPWTSPVMPDSLDGSLIDMRASPIPQASELGTPYSSFESEEPGQITVPWVKWAPQTRCFVSPPPGADVDLQEHVHFEFMDSSSLDFEVLRAAFLIPYPQLSISDSLFSDTNASSQTSAQNPAPESPNKISRIRVLDFNPRPIKRGFGSLIDENQGAKDRNKRGSQDDVSHVHSPLSNTFPRKYPPQQSIVIEPDRIECPGLFEEPLFCGSELPFRYMLSEESFYGVTGVMLDDERIIGTRFRAEEDGGNTELVVLTM